MDAWWQAVAGALLKEASALADPGELVQAPLRLPAGAHGTARGAAYAHARFAREALTVVAAVAAGMSPEHVSRVMQGVSAGIGFIGGGVILKLTEKQEVRGLTTAVGLWMIAAIGMAAGLGRYLTVIVGTVLAWLVLSVLLRWEVEEDAVRH